MRGAILVPSGPDLRLREASLPPGRAPAAFAPLLGLRGGAIAASTVLTVGGPRGLHSGDRVPLILLLTAGAPGLEGRIASGVWTPRRGRQRSVAVRGEPALVVALGLLIGAAVVPDSLCLHALEDGALTIGAARFHGGAQPLLFSPRALRLGQTCVPAQPPKLDLVSANDASLQSGNITLPEGPHWCSMLRGSSLLTVWQRPIHCSIKEVPSLLTFVSGLWGEKRSNRGKLEPLVQCEVSTTKEHFAG